jgi:hypothetical protein
MTRDYVYDQGFAEERKRIAGLVDVRGGRARIIDSSSPGFGFFRLSFESLKSALVDASMLTGRRGRRGVRPAGREHPRLHPDHDGRYRPPRLTSTTKSVAPAQ